MNFFNSLAGNAETDTDEKEEDLSNTENSVDGSDGKKGEGEGKDHSKDFDALATGQAALGNKVGDLTKKLTEAQKPSAEEAQTQLKAQVTKMLNLQNPATEEGVLFPDNQFKYLQESMTNVFQQALQYFHTNSSGNMSEEQVKSLISANKDETEYTNNVTNTLTKLSDKLGIDENYLRYLATEKVKTNPEITLDTLVKDLSETDFSGIPKKSPQQPAKGNSPDLVRNYLNL